MVHIVICANAFVYQTQVKNIVSTAKFGDLIEFSYPIGYSHWAVYDEGGYIIHFAVAGKKNIS